MASSETFAVGGQRPATDPDQARTRDRRHVWHTWSPLSADRSGLLLSHGQGYRVWDVDGREYLEGCALNSTCGYAHPDVLRAMADQAARLHHTDMSLGSHELAGVLAERIASYLPGPLTKTLFVNSGSEGFDAAVLIAVACWSHRARPRSRVVSFARGYQGSTLLSRSMSSLPRTRHLLAEPVPVTYVDLPVPPAQLRRPESLPPLLAAFERAIGHDPDDLPAAVVVEPFLNVGGGVVLPPGFLRGLRELCDATGTLLVLDEVFTAYGRSGRMFACEREGVAPDLLVSSKGLAGGYVPIAAVTVRQEVHDTFAADPVIGGLRYGHTTSGHAVACAAALATLDVIEKEGLLERAEHLGGVMRDRLAPLAELDGVTDVRGLGLLAVVEMCSPEAAAQVLVRAREHGLLLRQQGDAVLAVPPLVVDDEGIAALLDRVERAVPEAVGR
jgi:adenosylmethionine-8-amino-7-oxononanoate aminotransferase